MDKQFEYYCLPQIIEAFSLLFPFFLRTTKCLIWRYSGKKNIVLTNSPSPLCVHAEAVEKAAAASPICCETDKLFLLATGC